MGREVRRVAPGWSHPVDSSGYVPLLPHGSGCNEPHDHDEDCCIFDDDECMPDFGSAATMLMMYENTSEGTPISPAFETAESLARWLTDSNANAFGGMAAGYESWLAVCLGGWAPSLVVAEGVLMSGVEAARK